MSGHSFTLVVKVSTKASVNQIMGFEGEILKIKVTAVPERGKANEVVIELLSRWLKVPKSALTIVKGHTSHLKKISVEKSPYSENQLRARMDEEQ